MGLDRTSNLIEIKGDVHESQPTSMAEDSQQTEDGGNTSVLFLCRLVVSFVASVSVFFL